MHIWLAPSAFYPHRGGVEELTMKLAGALAAAGHSVLIIAPQHPPSLPARDVVEGLPVLRLRFEAPGRSVSSLRSYLLARRVVARHLDQLPRPDVVHVICPSVQLDPVARWARERRVPLVLTSQGETEMDAHGLYQKSLWMRYVLRREAARAAALTACSAWTAQRAAVVAPPFGSAAVILNGVDPDDWATITTADPGPIVAAWGRHVPQKGLDLLINAFPLVAERVPGARLIIGGDGAEEGRLRAMAGSDVTFLGPLDREAVRELLASARVVVVPSRIEPFGIVAVEALAAGRNLVYSIHGGLGEAAGDLGHAVDPTDREALARSVVLALREDLDSIRARQRAQELSWDKIAREYERIYEACTRAA